MRKLINILLLFTLTLGSCNAQLFHRNPEKGLFGKTRINKKEIKVREPRAVLKAKKKQEKNDRKKDKAWLATVRKSQKHTIEIQTPEVQTRMKQNKKDTEVRDKLKKKKVHSATKRAGKKYK